MKQRIRDLLHATPFLPFTIRMSDGKTYNVDDPHFVLAAPTEHPRIFVQQPDGKLDTLPTPLITSIEVATPPAVG